MGLNLLASDFLVQEGTISLRAEVPGTPKKLSAVAKGLSTECLCPLRIYGSSSEVNPCSSFNFSESLSANFLATSLPKCFPAWFPATSATMLPPTPPAVSPESCSGMFGTASPYLSDRKLPRVLFKPSPGGEISSEALDATSLVTLLVPKSAKTFVATPASLAFPKCRSSSNLRSYFSSKPFSKARDLATLLGENMVWSRSSKVRSREGSSFLEKKLPASFSRLDTFFF